MSNTKLKYYVRLDASGRPISGSVIKRQVMPKIGRWQKLATSQCCNGVSVIIS